MRRLGLSVPRKQVTVVTGLNGASEARNVLSTGYPKIRETGQGLLALMKISDIPTSNCTKNLSESIHHVLLVVTEL